MKQLGICLRNFGPSEFTWRIIKQINENKHKLNLSLFFEDNSNFCLEPNCSTMSMSEAYSYRFPIITTEILTAQKIAAFPCPITKVFYIYDLEWIHVRPLYFQLAKEVYTNKKLKFATRTNEYAKILEKTWGIKNCEIVPDADLQGLLNATHDKYSYSRLPQARILG